MSKMISVASGFQYSVNIGYDLNNDDKLKNFIPTKSALMLLKDILSSTALDATERARVLVGAYGKGKSHIILTILSVLMQRDRSLFTHLMPKINEDPELKQLVDNYYSDKKIGFCRLSLMEQVAAYHRLFFLHCRERLMRMV